MKYFTSQGRHQTSRWCPPTQSSGSSSLSPSHRGSPGKPVAVPCAMKYWQANSCTSRWRREDWICCCNSQWDVDGSTARGWTSWTGGNGWGDDDWSSGRRIDSDPMVKRIKLSVEPISRTELLEERVSSLEKEVVVLRQAAVASPEPKAACAPLLAQHACEWHERRPSAGAAVSVVGRQEEDSDAWLAHLRSTLYSSNEHPLDMLEGKIKANWERIEVTACRTKANRFFHVRCKQCNQYSYGQFGTWAVSNANGEDTAGGARDDLAKFFNFQGVPSGKPQV